MKCPAQAPASESYQNTVNATVEKLETAFGKGRCGIRCEGLKRAGDVAGEVDGGFDSRRQRTALSHSVLPPCLRDGPLGGGKPAAEDGGEREACPGQREASPWETVSKLGRVAMPTSNRR